MLTEGERRLGLSAALTAGLFLYLCSPYCPWEWFCESSEWIAATLGAVQYSWRFLTVAVVMLCGVLTIVVRALGRQKTLRAQVTSCALLLICLMTAVQAATEYYDMDPYMEDRFDAEIFWNYDYALSYVQRAEVEDWILSGDGPVITVNAEASASNAEEDSSGTPIITDYQRTGAGYTFSFLNITGSDITVTVPVYWYGLHTAYLVTGGEEELVLEDAAGTVTQFTEITIPAEITEGTVELRITLPWYYAVGDWISLICVILLIVWIILTAVHSRSAAGTTGHLSESSFE